MLKLNLSACQVDLNSPAIKAKAKEMMAKEMPQFTKHAPNLKRLEKVLAETKKFKNIIVAGRGGSITAFQAVLQALKMQGNEKKAFILNSSDIDRMNEVKLQCPPQNSLFVCISRSGTNFEVLENLLAFQNYPIIIVTERNEGALRKIVEKKEITFLEHPKICGRFSAGTFTMLLPAKLAGLNAEEVLEGLKDGFERFSPQAKFEKNLSLKAALVLDELEQKGFTEIFMPFYSPRLTGFMELVTQLMHESVCKEGEGQTLLTAESPEAQHHTSQRFFGGRKNMAGFFVRVEKNEDLESKMSVPSDLRDIPVRDAVLGTFHGLPLHKTMEFEFEGTFQTAKDKGIPVLSLSLEKITPYFLGQLIAFFHFLAVYSAWLRKVNPFDQPAVESSKQISFELRKNFKS